MSPAVEPLTLAHIAAAASLAAERHQADRAREPTLPARLTDAAQVAAQLDALIRTPDAAGVAAYQDGALLGFLLGVPWLPDPTSTLAQTVRPRSLRIPYVAHAGRPGLQVDLYRELYAALAQHWVRSRLFSHYVTVSACDRESLEAWLSLGFAHERITGVRSLALDGLASRATDAHIRRATTADLETLVALSRANDRYHAGAPMFDAYLPEAEAETRQSLQNLVQEQGSAVWLAERSGTPLGVLTLQRSQEIVAPSERTIHLDLAYLLPDARGAGTGSALLAQALRWAHTAGYEWCTATWHTANITGGRYWLHVGFRPLSYRLSRHIDDRTAGVSPL